MEALGQQRLHVLDEEPHARVEPAGLLLWLRGRLALGRRSGLRGTAVGVLGHLCDLLAGTQTGVSQANGFSFLLSAA